MVRAAGVGHQMSYPNRIRGKSEMAQFQKGQSGNPSGRPKGIISQRQRLINGLKKHCGLDAEEFIFSQMHDAILAGDSSILRLAIEQYLGKPHQTSENVNIDANEVIDSAILSERLSGTEKGRELLRIVEADSDDSEASRAS